MPVKNQSILYSFLFCLTLLLVYSILGSTMAASPESPINVSMSASRGHNGEVLCNFEFTNTADEDYYIGTYSTPLEGIYSSFLTITYQDGTDVQYMGILARRLPPTKKTFKLIKAGETISASVDLTEAYIFDKDGTYTIVFDRTLACLSAKEISKFSDDDELPQGGWKNVVLVKAEINLSNTSSLKKLPTI
ncbi:PREDICTED: uncharacterized protein LOC100635299 isoform X1 [Amphimedon queenslandica]|uniref:C1q domain-containing protein n=1 Tax=Amphimedon queenslandica TaxID=400682 RepID=A0AAN0IAK0_AMPQE|nr:PREDICTED: uncharacterized protein LOC100635299 isoform X1 [Amphimedon queenslandica]|eukprot:XP_003384046.1 PREDICTED: uncharacterized protein LOC100635299 isoform X1 [Amphimedon queenslandica]